MVTRVKQRMVISRLLQALPILVLATFIVFCLMQLIPGDVAVTLAGENASVERIAEIRQAYGLDQPFFVQYGQWLWQAASGDLGTALLSGEPVAQTIARTFPNTLLVAVYATLLSIVIGVPLGILAATRSGSKLDGGIMGAASLGVALPNFWFGMILVLFFALTLRWFPATGFVSPFEDFSQALWYATLPALALCTNGIAEVARQLRSSLVEIQSSQHVRTLHAKGLSPARILWLHGLKNVSVNLLTVVGLLFNKILAATVVVEAVFAIPGIGSSIVNAVLQGDFPVVQGAVLAMVVTVIVVNLLTDLLCTLLDPRINAS
ncbi:Binding-protein-dependent transport systems inner membrane component [Alloalcanivorax dieselolei B5]|uniref:Binding-protein-dependent transport systems inner membrane component n=2 Tax=Alloalcanivorax TaxID=3020832 RepID=K0C8D1_ALCDB|nr:MULTISPECIES: ABC transporter permease [Alloalcanivorax]AFT68848.1 Binding-protein-dependent transport systems inner membrane component [Alloalcanivorax dieselolei B5]MCU5783375.1 ABC transporter inner membrane protein [Alloalcanivorax balearicus MACL04]GGK06232.1 ABC transporter permease [Alloalcanivorax dieselolei]